MHVELIASILGSAAIMVWRLAIYAQRLKTAEDEVQKLRDWKHDKLGPLLQILISEREFLRRRLAEYDAHLAATRVPQQGAYRVSQPHLDESLESYLWEEDTRVGKERKPR